MTTLLDRVLPPGALARSRSAQSVLGALLGGLALAAYTYLAASRAAQRFLERDHATGAAPTPA